MTDKFQVTSKHPTLGTVLASKAQGTATKPLHPSLAKVTHSPFFIVL